MLDKSLPYYNMIMRCPAGAVGRVEEAKLPPGYAIRTYLPGDRATWADVEYSVGEFSEPAKALDYYDRSFLILEDMLPGRQFFVVDPEGRAVATATAWFFEHEAMHHAAHWVACRPEEQGRGLGRAVVCHALRRLADLEPGQDVWLHTQTWSHRAIGLYLRLGFYLCKTDRLAHYKNDGEIACETLKGVMRADRYMSLVLTAK